MAATDAPPPPPKPPLARRALRVGQRLGRAVAVIVLLGFTGFVMHRLVAGRLVAESGEGRTVIVAAGERLRQAVDDARDELPGTRKGDGPPGPSPIGISRTIAPTEAPVPEMLIIESRPPGAAVRIGDERIGNTPVITSVDVLGDGALVHVTAPGHRPWQGRLSPSPEGIRIEVRLERAADGP